MTKRRSALVLSVLVLFASSNAAPRPEQRRQEKRRGAEERNRERRQDCRRSRGRSASAERSRAVVGARGRAEGTGQQAVRALHGPDRSVEGQPARTSPSTGVWWRRARRRRPRPPDAKKDDKNDNNKGRKSEFAYEDISFVPVTPGQTPMRISRSFTVPAGDYDVFLVAKEPTPEKAPKNAPPPKMSVVKQIGHRARLLERRADDELGDRRRSGSIRCRRR